MRIISGKYKGKRITIPKQFRSRPTTDFAKENLFNIVSNYFDFEKLCVLELFAGTGSISFEFASRGCTDIDLVEADYKTCMFIDKVINSLNLEKIKPIKADVFKFIKYCGKTYDIIFADPPYKLEQIDILPSLIFENNLLKERGWFILEHSKKHDFVRHSNYFDRRVYGSVNFSFFKDLKNL